LQAKKEKRKKSRKDGRREVREEITRKLLVQFFAFLLLSIKKKEKVKEETSIQMS